MYTLKLSPALKDYIWGGRRLKDEYGIETDLERVAEAWVFSCHKDGQSTVMNGELAGKTLNEAVEAFGPDCLGTRGRKFAYFPLLIKLIDAEKDLSVQVHPDDEYALSHEKEYGKTEMWYVIDAKPDAALYYGFKHNIKKEEFKRHIDDNTLTDVLNRVPVKKGDCFFIGSGTIHAIGKGILIAEIQQNSNTTYRVYDYGRLGADGKPRPLHIDKALDVTELAPPKQQKSLPKDVLADCEYFKVVKRTVDGVYKACVGSESFAAVLCLSGELEFNGITLKKGECAFIPADTGEFDINGRGEFLESRV